VEIILNMREKMDQMQSQIQEFVASLNRELVSRTVRASEPSGGNSLIPVINARVPTAAAKRR
jgi:hypothetical protein